MEKNLVIVTSDSYPNGDAGAVRQHCLAKLFLSAGYHVFVIGYGAYTGDLVHEYDGISYISMRPDHAGTVSRAMHRFTFGHSVMKVLQKLPHPDVILVVDMMPDGFFRIRNYAKKHGCLLLHDSVEWYSPEEYKGGRLNWQYLCNSLLNRVTIRKPWRVIAISQYLQEHFEKKNLQTIRVPAVLEVDKIPFRLDVDNEKLCFVYAGSPGRKDYIKEMVEGFALLSDTMKQNIELHLIGITREDMIKVCGVSSETLEAVSSCLRTHGRLPREEVLKRVASADFTLLLRDNSLRYAKAGFPTKIVESLTCGTPPVCNYSSDLEMFLHDGQNAVIVHDCTPSSVSAAIGRAAGLGPEDRHRLRENARMTAQNCFDYRIYLDEINKIL